MWDVRRWPLATGQNGAACYGEYFLDGVGFEVSVVLGGDGVVSSFILFFFFFYLF